MSDASGVETGVGVSQVVQLRHNAGFRMLWIGQVLSDTGSEIGLLAYASRFVAGRPHREHGGRRRGRDLRPVCHRRGADHRAREQLEQAWAATEARTYGAGLAGPALGGVLFGVGRAVPFLADAVSFGVSLATVSRIRGQFQSKKTAQRKALWREVADGILLVWQVPVLRAVVVQGPLINFAFNGVLFTITLSLRQHGTSTVVIGLAQTSIAVGGLLGALLAARLQRRVRLSTLTITISVAGTMLYGVAALVIPSPLVLVPVAMIPLLSPAANAGLLAALLRSAPEEMRGRVSNTLYMLAMGLAALAPLLAGLLVQHVSDAWAIGAFAAAQAVSAVLCLTMSGLPQTESH